VEHCVGADAAPPIDAAVRTDAVTRALWLDGAAFPFFAGLGHSLQSGQQSARHAGVPGLAQFIQWYDAEVTATCAWLADSVAARMTAFLDIGTQGRGTGTCDPPAPSDPTLRNEGR